MTQPSIRVLLVEDNPGDVLLTREFLREASPRFELDVARNLAGATAMLAAGLSGGSTYDALLLDLMLPDSAGIATFRHIHALFPRIPTVVLTGMEVEDLGLQAVAEGAEDYLGKCQITGHLLARALRYAMERSQRRRSDEALEAAREQLRIAHQIQQRILPKGDPQLSGLDLSGGMYPASEVGADYFDYLPMTGDRLGILVGDVMGHGLGPALLASASAAAVRALALTHHGVEQILGLANQILTDGLADGRFITMLLASVDCRTRTLAYASAGHPTGLLLDADGATKGRLGSTGFPLALFPEARYQAGGPLPLERGDLLVLYSDGIIDAGAAQGDAFRLPRLVDAIRSVRQLSARQIVEHVHAAVLDHCGETPLDDDMTLVVAKVTE
ncbi:response regulator [bacterium]|nr:response regulator [bacterium]